MPNILVASARRGGDALRCVSSSAYTNIFVNYVLAYQYVRVNYVSMLIYRVGDAVRCASRLMRMGYEDTHAFLLGNYISMRMGYEKHAYGV